MENHTGKPKPVDRKSVQYRTVKKLLQGQRWLHRTILSEVFAASPSPEDVADAVRDKYDEFMPCSDSEPANALQAAFQPICDEMREANIKDMSETYADLLAFDGPTVEAAFAKLAKNEADDNARVQYAKNVLQAMEDQLAKIVDSLPLKTRCIIAAVTVLNFLEACSDVTWPSDRWTRGDLGSADFVLAHAKAFEGDKDMAPLLRAVRLAQDLEEATGVS